MPRVLIAGCGYVGCAAGRLFEDQGWEVEGWTSSAASAAALRDASFRVRAVDITAAAAVTAAQSDYDAVIQCVSSRGGNAEVYRQIYLRGAQNLTAAFPKATLVFTSSTSVYAQTDGEWVTENSAANPPREAGVVLRETEEFVLANRGVVARLAGIYGPGRSALLRKFLDGTARIDGSRERFVNQVHRDDIAAALFVLAGSQGATAEPRIFNVADTRPLTERECYEWLARHYDRPLPAIATEPIERKRGNTNKRVSSEKLRAAGWVPRFTDFCSGMQDSVIPELARSGA